MKVYLLLSLFVAASVGDDYFTQEPPTYIIGSYGDIVTFNCTASSNTLEVHLLVDNSTVGTHEGITVTHISPYSLMVTVNISNSTSGLQLGCIAVDPNDNSEVESSEIATVILSGIL